MTEILSRENSAVLEHSSERDVVVLGCLCLFGFLQGNVTDPCMWESFVGVCFTATES